ncbi:MAG: phosphatidate cytidylyltransferase [Ignavibacteriaceae bacterium]|nr:phosphatidate cytidylyltransferase [Ignavibacteriaceae bacterium]
MLLSNTAIRIIVSVIAIPLILLASYLGEYFFLTFVSLIGLISYFEFHLLAKNKSVQTNLLIGSLFTLLIILNQYFHLLDVFLLILLFLIATLTAELFRNKGSAIMNLGATYLGVFYLGFCSASLVALREFFPRIDNLYSQGGFLIISILAAIWICDSAAFFGGTAMGKHKLFTRVSPKKSWEGAIFGFIFAVASMALAKFLVLGFLSWSEALIIGFIIGTIGQIGDLIESLLKRDSGIKDSSSLIPGHGGVFDRFDSLLFSSPAILIFLRYI